MNETVEWYLSKSVGLSLTRSDADQILEWTLSQEPSVSPPHALKGISLIHCMRKRGYDTLVETGTHLGAMPDIVSRFGYRVYTIELSLPLYERARDRFANNELVTCIHGDSGVVLPEVVAKLTRPALFWLDGHICGGLTARSDLETPILAEVDWLRRIRGERPEFIDGCSFYIDDVREFGTGEYPKLSEVLATFETHFPRHVCQIVHDCLRVVPAAPAGQ
ncbi:MAG: hypothetical protein ABT940_03805 [Alphaproteobacteria bacterium]